MKKRLSSILRSMVLGGLIAPQLSVRSRAGNDGRHAPDLSDTDVAELVGAGYAPRGTMKGNVLIPIRLKDGFLIGYVGITELLCPPRWHLPEQKVVHLKRRS